MAVAWPGTLPATPLLDGWQKQLADNRYKFEPRQGRPIMRRKQSTRLDEQDVTFKLSLAQEQIFEEYYHTDLSDGVLSFTLNDPITGDPTDFQFIGSPPVITSDGVNYLVRARIMRIS